MKKLFLLLFFNVQYLLTAQVGIGTNTPNESSILDINVDSLPNNNKKGLLIPRVELAGTRDVSTIPNPANGLLVYNTVDAGVNPNNVLADNFYKYNLTNTQWELLYNQRAFTSLGATSVGMALGFLPSGNNRTYLGPNLGANIRLIMFDDIRLQGELASFNNVTKEFTANVTGYFNFQVNLAFRGPFNGGARLGVSKPYTGARPTLGLNSLFGLMTQQQFNADGNTPVTLSVNGILFMNKGEKVIFLTRYVTPTTNTLNVEDLRYDRTFLNSVYVTYFNN